MGCPKLDGVDYSEKLTEIIRSNDIQSVTIVRMEVPCCGGLEHAAKTALQQSGKFIPWQVVTISTDGRILELRKHTPIPEAIPAGGVEEGHSSAVNWNLSYSHHIDLAGIPFIP